MEGEYALRSYAKVHAYASSKVSECESQACGDANLQLCVRPISVRVTYIKKYPQLVSLIVYGLVITSVSKVGTEMDSDQQRRRLGNIVGVTSIVHSAPTTILQVMKSAFLGAIGARSDLTLIQQIMVVPEMRAKLFGIAR